MAVVYSKVLLFDPPLIYTAPDTCVFGAVAGFKKAVLHGDQYGGQTYLVHYDEVNSMFLHHILS